MSPELKMRMTMDDLLFYNERRIDLSGVLRHQTEKMKEDIADTPATRMNGGTDEELIEHFISKYELEPLHIHEDQAEADHKETKVDVSHDHFRRFIPDGSGPVMVKGDAISIRVPFTGDPELFKYTPSTRNYNPPRGRVNASGGLGGTVTLSLALPSDTGDSDRFNRWIKEQLDGLKQYESWIRNDVTRFNNELRQHAQHAVTARRQQLEKQGSLFRKLSIPIRPRSDAPSPTPIPMPKKVVKPLPKSRPVEQEYGISNEDYEYILKIIRQESRSFESTPATFAGLGEEALRDVVLAHLNGHFEGAAAGERFRKHGKTDICIEHENRAAFVAECKLWKGPKAFGEAIDQLLGYLTWRDTKTALVVWNKTVKDFANLQESVPKHLREHDRFVRMLDAAQAGEWRGVFCAVGDDAREIVVHVFIVDLVTSPSEAQERNAS